MLENPNVKRFLKLLPATIVISVILGLTNAGALAVYGAMLLLALIHFVLLDHEERGAAPK